MDAKPTPGPWEFYTEPQPNGCPIVGARGLMIAMLAHSINYDDQRETAIANARLIAAAPELLEALRECELTLRVMGLYSEPLARMANNARATITKATGAAA